MKHPDFVPLYKIVFSNKIGRLLQVIHDIKGTNNSFFVGLVDIPKHRKITCGKLVLDLNHTKKIKNKSYGGWR